MKNEFSNTVFHQHQIFLDFDDVAKEARLIKILEFKLLQDFYFRGGYYGQKLQNIFDIQKRCSRHYDC